MAEETGIEHRLAQRILQIVQAQWRKNRDAQAVQDNAKTIQGAIDDANSITLKLSESHALLADTFAEIASAAADMADLSKPLRISKFHELAQQTVDAIAWVVHRDVRGVRAVVYEVTDDGTGMEPVSWVSNGNRLAPNPFSSDTDRGRKAFKLLERGATLFVGDIASTPREQWAGSGNGYNTFISSPITSPIAAYGLLTVDAPETDDLTEEDENDLRLIASILATIFAEYRRRTHGPGV